ncbi:MAG TPA: helix-turn-helix domain-containing protein [Bryobacteraceae bacterium]|nr:helix-turn-helix domain-containing protein [Bryobacteraceae bacterium]
MTEKLLGPVQVADQLGVSVAWVRDHATRKQPRLPMFKIGGLLKCHPEDLERWVERMREAGARRAS